MPLKMVILVNFVAFLTKKVIFSSKYLERIIKMPTFAPVF